MTIEKMNIHQRIHGIMSEFTYVQKVKSGMPYKSVSHDDVTEKLQPLLQKYRVICRPYVDEGTVHGNQTKVLMVVEWVNIDRPEDVLTTRTIGLGNDPQDKGPGKAMSYAVKYAILKTLSLVTGDDPENDSIPTRGGDEEAAPSPPRLTQPQKGTERSKPARGGAPAPPSTDRPLKPGEIKSLWITVRKAGVSEEQFREFLGGLGVESTKELHLSQTAAIATWLGEQTEGNDDA